MTFIPTLKSGEETTRKFILKLKKQIEDKSDLFNIVWVSSDGFIHPGKLNSNGTWDLGEGHQVYVVYDAEHSCKVNVNFKCKLKVINKFNFIFSMQETYLCV